MSKFAHIIPEHVSPLRLPGFPEKRLQNNAVGAAARIEDFGRELGHPTYQGGNGSIWNVVMSSHVKRRLKSILSVAADETVVSWPKDHTQVAIKIQEYGGGLPFREQHAEWTNEVQAHESLHHFPFIPKLYLAATVGYYHITVMQHISGTPLHLANRVKPSVYQKIEHAIRQMWKEGYAHGDLHSYNILVTRLNQVFIIDFGSVVRLPERIRAQVAAMNDVDAETVWKEVIGPYVDAHKKAEGFDWYNPNGKALGVYKRMAEQARKELDRRWHMN